MNRGKHAITILWVSLLAMISMSSAVAQNQDQLIWGSYLGTTGWDQATSIFVDSIGAVYVAGSRSYTGQTGQSEDGYFAKMSSDGKNLLFRQFLGGSDTDAIYDILVDSDGNIVVAGRTSSADFPTTEGAFDRTYHDGGDLFVAKFDPTGATMLFSTFIGGSSSESIYEDCLALDASGDIYVTGVTGSPDFPVTAGAFSTTFNGGNDSFVVKLSADGKHVLYATYLGGTGAESTRGIAVNTAGEVYVKGFTTSTDFPTTSGAYAATNHGGQDIFVTKLNAAGSALVYSTYLGGSANEGGLYGRVVLTPQGEVYLSGYTDSADFPVTPGAYDTGFNGVRDSFVAKLSPTGQLVAATFLGGRRAENQCEIARDANGSIWCAGDVLSDNFPTTAGAYKRVLGSIQSSDIYLARLDAGLSHLEYSTVLGGMKTAETFVAPDPSSSCVYIWAGVYTYPDSPAFPTTPGAYSATSFGDRDGYLAKIDPTVHMGDTDGDGMPDWWELHYALNPNVNDANQDPDGDGMSNLEEFLQNRNPRSPQSKYRLGPATDLLDTAFYTGQAIDGSNVAGRWAFWGRAASDGKTVAFWALNVATNQSALFLVDIGAPSSWRRLTPDMSDFGPIAWTPDGRYVIANGYRVPVTTGELLPHSVFGFPVSSGGVAATQYAADNWVAILAPPALTSGDLLYAPILGNGDEDPTRQPVRVTNMTQNSNDASWQDLSPDANAVAFQTSLTLAPDPNDSKIYVLRDVDSILQAPKTPGTNISSLAPTALSDSRFVPIRNTSNWAGFPHVSADGSMVLYSEESSGLIRSATDILSELFQSDWDVMISNLDGSGMDYALAEPGNQAWAIPTPGGMRMLYSQEVGNEMRLMASTLEVKSDLAGTIIGPPANNVVLTSVDQTATDASGTAITVPTNTTVTFPADAPQAIQITTPIDPATAPQLPPSVEAVPVIRQFGPQGTQFNPPISVTISYTDAEVEGLNEPTLRVFLFNKVTGLYDQEVTTILARDLVHNTITFSVSHFSTYGLGGAPLRADVDHNTVLNAIDLQLVINAALGLDVGASSPDVNIDGKTDAVDIQLVIIALLQR